MTPHHSLWWLKQTACSTVIHDALVCWARKIMLHNITTKLYYSIKTIQFSTSILKSMSYSAKFFKKSINNWSQKHRGSANHSTSPKSPPHFYSRLKWKWMLTHIWYFPISPAAPWAISSLQIAPQHQLLPPFLPPPHPFLYRFLITYRVRGKLVKLYFFNGFICSFSTTFYNSMFQAKWTTMPLILFEISKFDCNFCFFKR